jgi:hypothetical protein
MPTATYHRHRLLPSASALLLGYAATSTLTTTLVNSQQCTLCEDGSAVDPSLNIGSATCTEIDMAINATALGSPTCIDAQLEGYKNCACPTFPDVFCSMCGSDGSFEDIPNDRTKVAFTGQTCANLLFVKEATLDSCLDITKYQTLCQCPNAPAAPGTCIMCGDGTEFRNADTVVDTFGTTCQQALDYAPFATDTECASVVAPLADMCCAVPGSPTRTPTLAPSPAPTNTPSSSTPTTSPISDSDRDADTTNAPSNEPSAAVSTTTTSSSWQYMVTFGLGAMVAAFW